MFKTDRAYRIQTCLDRGIMMRTRGRKERCSVDWAAELLLSTYSKLSQYNKWCFSDSQTYSILMRNRAFW